MGKASPLRVISQKLRTQESHVGWVHFPCATVEWETPQWHFDELPCTTPKNTKCASFFTRAEDGLAQPWEGKVFCNPPYGREIGAWVEKAHTASLTGALVVCMLPARTDTRWWRDYVRRGHVWFLRGQLKFGQARNTAPFPSAIVIFGRHFSS